MNYQDYQFNDLTAFVIDNNDNERQILCNYLKDCGVKVLEASDTMSVKEECDTYFNTSENNEEQLCDLFFINLIMPKMNGIELTRYLKIKQRTLKIPEIKRIPVCLMTPDPNTLAEEMRDILNYHYLRSGLDFLLVKPIILTDLVKILQYLEKEKTALN